MAWYGCGGGEQKLQPIIYSTNEHIVGTWIDGSSIYERTVVLPNTATANSLTLLMSDTDLSALNIVSTNIIDLEIIARSEPTQYSGSPRVNYIGSVYSKGNFENGITISFTNNNLYYQCRYGGEETRPFDIYLTFRYTKST